MAEYITNVEWQRRGATFTDNKYSRAHTWQFDGGASVPASSSPHVVPVPYSDAAGVDPEEAYVAALSSCHMLWFLSIAARRGFVVDRYTDQAVGVMAKNDAGQWAITRVTLHPHVVFSGSSSP
ncbi:MAG TPA: OsmC family protein, partial [Chloroflexota bacterium]|nr:OsmC family protein [Chloroflexota bacterium]